MTCRDVMTPDPRFCYANDTVVRAAQIMREENVGPVPVVADAGTRKLVGLITDRDLAINVVAEGRDPANVEAREVMSKYLVTCGVDDDFDGAVQAMSRHQLRRIPVVYSDGSIAGIISQADVARVRSASEVGALLEEISDASGPGARIAGASRRAGSSLIPGAMAVSLGAAAMYLFDPDRGRSRRKQVRDKTFGYYKDSAYYTGKVRRDLQNRTTGLMASAKSRVQGGEEEVSDDVLIARVRSRMGHHVSHPHALAVSAREGHVTVDGPILAKEVPGVLSAIRAVPGVKSVENRLSAHESAAGIPSLQGSSDRHGGRWEFMKADWSPATRVIAGALGGGLAIYGLSSRGSAATAASLLGFGLLARGVTNKGLTDLASLPSSGYETGNEEFR